MSKSIRDQIKLSELLKQVPNRFLLTVASAKRARQLDDGARPLIDASLEHNRSLDIALLEIQLGKVKVSLEPSQEEDSIIDEISDYLDTDFIEKEVPATIVNTAKKKS